VEEAPGVGDNPVGFHYQQTAETLLKALLAECDVDYPLRYDLTRLRVLAEEAVNRELP
jgi:HEPN domain-containing protein